MKRFTRIRPNPKLSAWLAAQYVCSPRWRADEIVREAAISQWGPRVNYRGLHEAIARNSVGGAVDIDAVRSHVRSSPLNEQTRALQLQAVSALEAIVRSRKSDGPPLHVGSKPERLEYAPVHGVQISANPSLEVLTSAKGDRVRVVQLVFKKTNPLDEESGPMCAVVVEEAVRGQHGGSVLVEAEVIDVFAGRSFRAPPARKRISSRLEGGLSGLRAHWAEVVSRQVDAA